MDKDKNVKIGLFGIGLDLYRGQFDDLKDKLLAHKARVGQKA